MNGFIEIKEDSYEDTLEHLQRIKLLACKLIKMLSEHSEIYKNDNYYPDDDRYEDYHENRNNYRSSRRINSRYNY